LPKRKIWQRGRRVQAGRSCKTARRLQRRMDWALSRAQGQRNLTQIQMELFCLAHVIGLSSNHLNSCHCNGLSGIHSVLRSPQSSCAFARHIMGSILSSDLYAPAHSSAGCERWATHLDLWRLGSPSTVLQFWHRGRRAEVQNTGRNVTINRAGLQCCLQATHGAEPRPQGHCGCFDT
jgi:hypothetical protein